MASLIAKLSRVQDLKQCREPRRHTDRYRKLIGKRQREVISPQEWQELRRLTGELEIVQRRRTESLAKLAELRRVSVTEVMSQLEIQPPDVL